MTPQQLMDLPYVGMAEKQLRKQGDWDDIAALVDGETDMEFTVEVSGTYYPEMQRQTFTVIAKTEEEAMDEAEDMSDFDEIEDAKITAIKEATT